MHDHSEAVLVEFDPQKVSYEELLDIFWQSHEPTADQYSRQYRNAVFYLNDEQKSAILSSLQDVRQQSRYPVTTAVEPAGEFYPAEGYHQKYYLRKRHEILAELQQNYSGDSFVDTTAAARINGYLGCNGDKTDVERNLDSLGLSPGMQQRLVDYVSGNCRRFTGLTCPAPPK
jgi:hypothetical protein